MAEAQDRTPPAGAAKAAPVTPAKQPAAKPADAPDKDRENAEVGALRARVAQLEEERSQERRTSNPGSPDFNAELALEELWPGSVRDEA